MPSKIKISELDKWYSKKISKKTKNFRNDGKKIVSSIKKLLPDIIDVAERLGGSEEAAELDGIAYRYGEKIKELVNSLAIPDEITYTAIERLEKSIRSFFVEITDWGRRWIPRLDKKYKPIIRDLDHLLKLLQGDYQKLLKFMQTYSWVKDLERIKDHIENMYSLIDKISFYEEQIEMAKSKSETAKLEFDKAEKELAQFMESAKAAELLSIDAEIKSLESEIKMKLSPLKKAFKKYQKAIDEHTATVYPGGAKAISSYSEDPLNAIYEDDDGYPSLKAALRGLVDTINAGNLSLKDRLQRRAIEESEKILNGSLLKIQKKAKQLLSQKNEILTNSDVYSKLKLLEDNLEEAKRNLEYHQNVLLKAEDDLKNHHEKIREYKSKIESEIYEMIEESVEIIL